MIIDTQSYEEFIKFIKELEVENARLRQQRDAANAVIQELNRIIAGDTE